jgi:hypothetical protein
MNRIYRMILSKADRCDTCVSIEPSNLLHPVHPVHPVEKSGFDLMVRIVANMIDPDRYLPNAAAAIKVARAFQPMIQPVKSVRETRFRFHIASPRNEAWRIIGEPPETARVTPRVHNASEATHMKTLKFLAAVAAALLLTALTIGANTAGSAARPTSVPSERWIAIGPNAGLAVNTTAGGTETAPVSGPPQQVVAQLYVKTNRGWQQARLDSPTQAIPLDR